MPGKLDAIDYYLHEQLKIKNYFIQCEMTDQISESVIIQEAQLTTVPVKPIETITTETISTFDEIKITPIIESIIYKL